MALSKNYQYTDIEPFLRVLVNEVTKEKIQDKTIMRIVNKNILDIAEMLNGATAPDYGTTAILSDVSSSVAAVVTSAQYTNSSRTVIKASHGFTVSDIGKRVVLYNSAFTTNMLIAEIESITDASKFVITKAYGGDIAAGQAAYAVFSAHSTTTLDVSSLKIDKIIKLTDSINGTVIPANDFDFDNLANTDEYENSVFYNHFGETLFLFKGSGVSAFGTLTLYYYRLPMLVSDASSGIDLKDKYIPLLIDKCKIDILELVNKIAPKELVQSVESKTQLIKNLNQEKESTIKSRAS